MGKIQHASNIRAWHRLKQDKTETGQKKNIYITAQDQTRNSGGHVSRQRKRRRRTGQCKTQNRTIQTAEQNRTRIEYRAAQDTQKLKKKIQKIHNSTSEDTTQQNTDRSDTRPSAAIAHVGSLFSH